VASDKVHLITINFGIVLTFEQKCCSNSSDWCLVLASLEYVGWIEEFLKLNYGRFQIVVLLYNWVVVNYKGSMATVKWDEYGFTLVNFDWLIPLSAQSFAFPMHVEQVFL
jgi:hypothetical protein